MRYILLFLILLVPFVGFLSYFISSYCRPHVEESLDLAARKALDKSGLQHVNVKFDHLDATLTGNVNSAAESKKAAGIINGLDAARLLKANNHLGADGSAVSPTPVDEGEVVMEEPPADPNPAVAPLADLNVRFNDTAVAVRGRVPSEAFRERVLTSVSAAKPGLNINGEQLLVDPEVEMPAWEGGMEPMLGSFLPSVAQGELLIDADNLVMAGSVPDEATRARFEDEAATWIGSADRVNSQLAVVAPEPPAEEETRAALVSVFKKNAIYFAIGKQTVAAEDLPKLREIAESVKASPGLRLFVGGYADKSGNPEANRRLSLARALQVKNQLVEFGLSEDSLVVESFGAEEVSAEEAWKSRRVELSIQE